LKFRSTRRVSRGRGGSTRGTPLRVPPARGGLRVRTENVSQQKRGTDLKAEVFLTPGEACGDIARGGMQAAIRKRTGKQEEGSNQKTRDSSAKSRKPQRENFTTIQVASCIQHRKKSNVRAIKGGSGSVVRNDFYFSVNSQQTKKWAKKKKKNSARLPWGRGGEKIRCKIRKEEVQTPHSMGNGDVAMKKDGSK